MASVGRCGNAGTTVVRLGGAGEMHHHCSGRASPMVRAHVGVSSRVKQASRGGGGQLCGSIPGRVSSCAQVPCGTPLGLLTWVIICYALALIGVEGALLLGSCEWFFRCLLTTSALVSVLALALASTLASTSTRQDQRPTRGPNF
jgi:hypothetical protein